MEFNDKQLEILKVAETLFAEEGFDGTSVRDIAKAANINIAMISYYFGSKEKLLEALILKRAAALKLKMENLFQTELSPIEKVEKMIDLYFDTINCNRNMYQILHFEIMTKKRTIDTQHFTEVKINNLKMLENVIHEGQQKRIFSPSVNIGLIPTLVIGTLMNFSMNRHFYEKLYGLTSDEAFESYINGPLKSHIKSTIKALLLYEA